ncbi:hypothetical protein [Acidiphilium sp.]|uniref:hypothetical protein n=1 Tax=Acidiphilium sp. TaxID=527 RepID=UPI00258BE8F5|nr:hypothetical protein [Acidiphilium sp.]
MGKMKEDEVCKLVRERLEHVDLIFNLRHQFNNPALIQYVGERGWTHPWRYFDALMYYLLFTCFDLLGQPSEWVSFSEWLESNNKATERHAVAADIQPNADPVAIARHFNSKYQSIYSLKTSFYNFLLKILTEGERDEFCSSIKIVRAVKGGDMNISYPVLGEINDNMEKFKFAFNLRNKFTHRAVIMGSPIAGIFPKAYDFLEINGVRRKGYVEIHRKARNDEWLIFEVRDWPFVLKRLIEAALSRRQSAL